MSGGSVLAVSAAARANVILWTGQGSSILQATGGSGFGMIVNAVLVEVARLTSATILAPTVALDDHPDVRDHGAVNPIATLVELIRTE